MTSTHRLRPRHLVATALLLAIAQVGHAQTADPGAARVQRGLEVLSGLTGGKPQPTFEAMDDLGWKVIKVVWGREWDPLLARDVDGVLVDSVEAGNDAWTRWAEEFAATREQLEHRTNDRPEAGAARRARPRPHRGAQPVVSRAAVPRLDRLPPPLCPACRKAAMDEYAIGVLTNIGLFSFVALSAYLLLIDGLGYNYLTERGPGGALHGHLPRQFHVDAGGPLKQNRGATFCFVVHCFLQRHFAYYPDFGFLP